MPKYIVSTLPESDVNMIADSMRRAGANVSGVSATSNSKRTSGRILLECSEELAIRLQTTEGVKYFEEEILQRIRRLNQNQEEMRVSEGIDLEQAIEKALKNN